MQVEGVPTYGCNYFTNNYSFTNYYNGLARSFVILEGKAIQTRQQSYTNIPTGYLCVDSTNVRFRADFPAYAQVLSIFLCALIGVLLWKTLGRILGR